MTLEEIKIAIAEATGRDMWVIMKRGLYYRPNAHGYTYNLSEAWQLPYAEAKEHEMYVDNPDVPFNEKVLIKRAEPLDYPNDLNAIIPVMPSGLLITFWELKDGPNWHVKIQGTNICAEGPNLAMAACECFLKHHGKWNGASKPTDPATERT